EGANEETKEPAEGPLDHVRPHEEVGFPVRVCWHDLGLQALPNRARILSRRAGAAERAASTALANNVPRRVLSARTIEGSSAASTARSPHCESRCPSRRRNSAPFAAIHP